MMQPTAVSINDVSPSEVVVIRYKEPVQILDVRTSTEFEEGHLPMALNIDYYGSQFEKNLNELDHSIPVIVYCRSGKRSYNTAQKMRKMGFRSIFNLEGGILEWVSQGYSTTK